MVDPDAVTPCTSESLRRAGRRYAGYMGVGESDPVETQRRAAAINELLAAIGESAPEDRDHWWNLRAHEELGGRTATAAWLAGDTEAVEAMVRRWYEASDAVAERVRDDPALQGRLRDALRALDERLASRGLNRTA